VIPHLDNRAARRLFMARHALLEPPSGPGKGDDLLELIRRLGFVQLDSVQTVARAHHMILHARRTAYRPPALHRLLERDRALFEHWTHDAAAIPMEFLCWWQDRFARDAEALAKRYKGWHREGWEERFRPVLDHIAAHGPCRTDAFADTGDKTGRGWWDWHPSKTALEYLWRSGRLAVCRREAFRKVYALASEVYPPVEAPGRAATVDWLMNAALDRLGFASPGELAAFWAGATNAEARDWAAAAQARGEIEEIAVEDVAGRPHRRLARPGTVTEAAALPPPPGLVRVLSPFDPMIRDRARAERLFGFRYRIEIFVPAAQRQYGYYVFPLMEGDRLIGRIDMTADRAADALVVTALWPEPGVKLGAARMARIEAALGRTARLVGVAGVAWRDGWSRDAG
jgi:hypothetical protein